ncbi:hypothetical protein Tco_0828327 [Tanacetum coccineum]
MPPDFDSEDDISWKSSDDDQEDDEQAEDDGDVGKNDVNETTQDVEDDEQADDDDDDEHDDDKKSQIMMGDDFVPSKTHDSLKEDSDNDDDQERIPGVQKNKVQRKEPASTSAPSETTTKNCMKDYHYRCFKGPADQSFEIVRRDDDVLYKFKEGDFHRLRIQDIEDMLLLLVQGKVTNLSVEERIAFNVSLRMFTDTNSVVIQRRVERSSNWC